jgi:hypothetical protein
VVKGNPVLKELQKLYMIVIEIRMEMVAVKSKQPEIIVRCVGERKEPSNVAVDRFISIYLEMVKENQIKLANQNQT